MVPDMTDLGNYVPLTRRWKPRLPSGMMGKLKKHFVISSFCVSPMSQTPSCKQRSRRWTVVYRHVPDLRRRYAG
jgi:hypothetical protein